MVIVTIVFKGDGDYDDQVLWWLWKLRLGWLWRLCLSVKTVCHNLSLHTHANKKTRSPERLVRLVNIYVSRRIRPAWCEWGNSQRLLTALEILLPQPHARMASKLFWSFSGCYSKKSFLKAFNLRTHILTHTQENPHRCTVCQFSCKKAGNLKAHMMIHIGVNWDNWKEYSKTQIFSSISVGLSVCHPSKTIECSGHAVAILFLVLHTRRYEDHKNL